MGYGYEEADSLFRDPGNLPTDNNVIGIETDVCLFAKDVHGHQNTDVVAFQSPQTINLVMRILYSAVKLRAQLEMAFGVVEAEEFFVNLQINLRFYKNASGEWAYMGGNRADGPSTQDLIGMIEIATQ